MRPVIHALSHPWPWYVAGPLIGLFVPALFLIGNKSLGISSNFRHLCAVVAPRSADFFRYDWRRTGSWNLLFVAGILIGGFVGGRLLASPEVAISVRTRADLAALGLRDFSGLVPRELFNWSSLATGRGLAMIVLGGFLIGFGTSWAGGCTSGHGITGLATLQRPSLLAVVGFFAGGVFTTYVILPLLI